MRPISEDLRKRIVTARERGESAQDISVRLGLHKRTVERCWKRYLTEGSYSSYKKGQPPGSRVDAYKAELLKWLEQKPGLTLEQLCQRLQQKHQVSISVSALWRSLQKYKLSYKKNDIRPRKKP